MHLKQLTITLSFLFHFLFAMNQVNIANIIDSYPVIEPDTAIDYYLGHRVVDPYRNLENLEDSAIKNWYWQQRELFNNVVRKYPYYDSLYKELESYYGLKKDWVYDPKCVNDTLYYSILSTTDYIFRIFKTGANNFNPVEVYNTDSVSKKLDDYFRIENFEPSYDGQYMVVNLKSDHDNASILQTVNLHTSKVLPMNLNSISWARPVWAANNKVFFYKQLQSYNEDYGNIKGSGEFTKVSMFNVETQQSKIVFSKKLTPQIKIDSIDFPTIYASPFSDYIIGALHYGTANYADLYIATFQDFINYKPQEIPWKIRYSASDKVYKIASTGNTLYLLSFKENSNGQIICTSLKGKPKHKVVFEPDNEVIEDIQLNNNLLYISTMKNGYNKLYHLNVDNNQLTSIPLISSGAIQISPEETMSSCYSNNTDLFYTFVSWKEEKFVYHYQHSTQEMVQVPTHSKMKSNILDNLIAEEVEVESHDGAMVPLSIIYPKHLKLDGNNPTIIYGYGSYGSVEKPDLYIGRFPWWNFNGIYAIAHVRGGGEKGEDWRMGGHKSTKYNSWKDFIACSEYLIEKGYTSPGYLTAEGSSAGGITVGMAVNTSPELYKNASIWAGILSVLRMDLSVNTSSFDEFGNPNDSIDFKYLFEMDVYHHINDTVCYPALYVTAGLSDNRVSPWRPAKFVARVQNNSCNKNPVLFKVYDGGHFGGDNFYTDITDYFSFLFLQMNRNFNK